MLEAKSVLDDLRRNGNVHETATNIKNYETKVLIEMAMSDNNFNGIVGWILETRPELDTLIKDQIAKSFCDWTYPKVMKFFYLSHVPRILRVPKAKCPEDIVNRVTDDLLTVCKLRGPITQCNEKGREKFIDVVLNNLFGRLSCFKIKNEGPFKSNIGYGNVEYVFTLFNSVVAMLLEVKRDDLLHGIAQITMELYAAHRINSVLGLKNERIIGILSTAEKWYFVEYHFHGDPVLSMSPEYSIIEKENETGEVTYQVHDVLEYLYGTILSTWVRTTKSFYIRMKTIYDEANSDVESYLHLNFLVNEMNDAIQLSSELETMAKEAKNDEDSRNVFQELIQNVNSVLQIGNKWNKELVSLTSDV